MLFILIIVVGSNALCMNGYTEQNGVCFNTKLPADVIDNTYGICDQDYASNMYDISNAFANRLVQVVGGTNNFIWMGSIMCRQLASDCFWIDTGAPLLYTNWATNQFRQRTGPSNLAMHVPTGTWYSNNTGSEKYNFFCQYTPQPCNSQIFTGAGTAVLKCQDPTTCCPYIFSTASSTGPICIQIVSESVPGSYKLQIQETNALTNDSVVAREFYMPKPETTFCSSAATLLSVQLSAPASSTASITFKYMDGSSVFPLKSWNATEKPPVNGCYYVFYDSGVFSNDKMDHFHANESCIIEIHSSRNAVDLQFLSFSAPDDGSSYFDIFEMYEDDNVYIGYKLYGQDLKRRTGHWVSQSPRVTIKYTSSGRSDPVLFSVVYKSY